LRLRIGGIERLSTAEKLYGIGEPGRLQLLQALLVQRRGRGPGIIRNGRPRWVGFDVMTTLSASAEAAPSRRQLTKMSRGRKVCQRPTDGPR
jgi:hypothetical protein